MITLIFTFMLFVFSNAYADKLAYIPMERLENDSDIVFLGYVKEQYLLPDKFEVLDSIDKQELLLDTQITVFGIEEIFKGKNTPIIKICSMLHPTKTVSFEKGKSYIIFAQKTGSFYQLTYDIRSMIKIEKNRVLDDLFWEINSDLGAFLTLKKFLRDFSNTHKKRIIKQPYNPYLGWNGYIIKNNPCNL